jgi:amidase
VQLADWQSANPIYGATRNPWDVGRSPGGSSGGSAVALAAGFSALELGSDIGGSIRMPAHFCGVWGHKPSLGLVPGRGHAQPGNFAPADMTVHGPMARSARDLDLALTLLAGAEDDTGGVTLRPPSGRQPKEYRVALLANDPDFPVDGAITEGLRAAAVSLARIGVSVVETRPADIPSRACYETYIALLRGATSGRQTDQEFAEAAREAARLDPADRSYRALMLRANTMTHRDWVGFNQQRHGFIAAWRRFFAEFDALLCPVASTPAFPTVADTPKYARTVQVDGRALPSANDYFWLGLASLCYLPATTVPIAQSPEGLPIGAQIVGAFGADRTCLEVAILLEDAHRAFQPPPMDRLG